MHHPLSHRAFSLIELLVVVSIIVIIISLLLPSLKGTRTAAKGAMCASNLHQLRVALQGVKGQTSHGQLPDAGAWVGVIASRGAADAMKCPLDEDQTPSGFDDMFIVQWDHTGHPDNGFVTQTPLKDVIDGKGLNDPQISWFRRDGIHRGSQLNGEDEFMSTLGVGDWSQLPAGQIAVSIDWSGRFVIDTNAGTITVYHKWPGDPNGGGSRHFIYDNEDEVAEIGGGKHRFTNNVAHQGYNPPFEIAGGVGVSYGMNSLITRKGNEPHQVLLLDYEKSIVNVGAEDYIIDDFDEQFAPRHLGRANVLFVDGSIATLTQAELEERPRLWASE